VPVKVSHSQKNIEIMMMMPAIIITFTGHAATRYTQVSTCHMGHLELVGDAVPRKGYFFQTFKVI